jgi:mono/diheme cytochrome c family protein
MDKDTLFKLMAASQPKVRATAVRLSESFLNGPQAGEFFQKLLPMADSDLDSFVQLQLGFTFGQSTRPEAMRGLRAVAEHSVGRELVREAVVTSLYGHELDFAQQLAVEWHKNLAECVANSRNTTNIAALLDTAADGPEWQQKAVLDGINPQGRAKFKKIYFASEPNGLLPMTANKKLAREIRKTSQLLTWPSQPGYVPPPVIPPLTADEQKSYDTGHKLFSATCAACHQPTGLGAGGVAPPLVDSEWVLGSPERLCRIVLQGAQGPIIAAGAHFDASMPSWATFTDEQVAGILTYIRRDWEQGASPISQDTVKSIRAAIQAHEGQWTSAELSKIH